MLMEFDSRYQFLKLITNLIWRNILKIIPLPYVKIFTNTEGVIESVCNLNNAPLFLCDIFYSYLTNHRNLDKKESRKLCLVTQKTVNTITGVVTHYLDDEKDLEKYSKPINIEFRLCRNFEVDLVANILRRTPKIHHGSFRGKSQTVR